MDCVPGQISLFLSLLLLSLLVLVFSWFSLDEFISLDFNYYNNYFINSIELLVSGTYS